MCTGKRRYWVVLEGVGLQPPSLMLALRGYNIPKVSTISQLRLLVVHAVHRLQTAIPMCTGRRLYQTVLYKAGPESAQFVSASLKPRMDCISG